MSDNILRLIIIAAALLYYSAFILFKFKIKRAAFLAWWFAFAANAVLLINNWVVNEYVPFVSMFQVLIFLSFCFVPIYFYLRFFCNGKWMTTYMSLPPAIIMTGLCFMDIKSVWHFPPALQSVWFVPHVLFYMIAYSMGAVALMLSIAGLFAKDKRLYSEGVYNSVRILFPFMTCGMFFGAIWANEIWGSFWSWDAKENWSLVTWLIYMLYLHFRTNKYLKKYAFVLPFIGFIAIVITFFFVNIFSGTSVHSYS